MYTYSTDERLAFGEYVEFLTRTDLGEQYPTLGFRERVTGLLESASVCVTARSDRLVGVCLAITDWNYFVFVTDIGVDRDCVGQGIGSSLLDRAIERIGRPEYLTVVTLSNERAVPLYLRHGLRGDDSPARPLLPELGLG